MSSLAIAFPDEWATMRVGDDADRTIRSITAAMAELSGESALAMDWYFTTLLSALDAIGVEGLASLAVPDDISGQLVQAFCAMGVEAVRVADAHRLRDVAEGGLHPGLQRSTRTVDLPLGQAIRSSAFRFAEELRDADGAAPYAFEVRFAFPMEDSRIGVLHFETLSLVYVKELEGLFDAVAGTAKLV